MDENEEVKVADEVVEETPEEVAKESVDETPEEVVEA